MIGFKKYDIKTVEEKIKKAVDNYLKRGGAKEKILTGEVKLPKLISPDGKVIDLEEKYKDHTVVAEVIGIVPAIIYVDTKRLGLSKNPKELKFIHFLRKPAYLVCDPEDNSKIYLAFTSNVKITERGIID